jgi:hypothetical protein
MQGLEVNDSLSPSSIRNGGNVNNGILEANLNQIKQILMLSQDLASLVLNRTTVLSQEDWNLVCEKVEVQSVLSNQVAAAVGE